LSSLLIVKELGWVRPRCGLGRESYDRVRLRDRSKRTIRRLLSDESRVASLHLPQEVLHVQSQEGRTTWFHVRPARVIQLHRTAEIAVAEMAQSDGRLDQPLIELSLQVVRLCPQVLPDFVGLEEVAVIEQQDARQIAGIVGPVRRAHAAVFPLPSVTIQSLLQGNQPRQGSLPRSPMRPRSAPTDHPP